eukprot:UN32982
MMIATTTRGPVNVQVTVNNYSTEGMDLDYVITNKWDSGVVYWMVRESETPLPDAVAIAHGSGANCAGKFPQADTGKETIGHR